MTFWEKITENPAYCTFEGAYLEMLDIKKSYLHFRFCIEGDLYEKYKDDLRDEYLDPTDRDLFIDMVFLSPNIIKEHSKLPPEITFCGEVYLVTALTKISEGVYSLSFRTIEGEIYTVEFSAKECLIKPFGEMDSSFYYNHPEVFDKPFSLKAFLKK